MRWVEKIGVKDLEYMFFLRSIGSFFCLNEFKGIVEYVYDCIVVYEGVL